MKPSGIGGQAVLEGIMMKNKSRYSVAVRKPDGAIEVRISEHEGIGGRHAWAKLPLIRGVVNFVDSLVLGMETLTYSAEFSPEGARREGGEGRYGYYRGVFHCHGCRHLYGSALFYIRLFP